ncbi:MAG: aspartate ammonia-lyase, partial [Bacteroidota bacterium]|nr:aspartate ammonia-lyase [Bacteroidota bacterium]
MQIFRTETDSIGSAEIPADALWGIHTARALRNFNLSGYMVNSRLIKAIAMVKKACCQANAELNFIDKTKSEVIINACCEIISGELVRNRGLENTFPIDAMQGGAGTSTNMNVNEVI